MKISKFLFLYEITKLEVEDQDDQPQIIRREIEVKDEIIKRITVY